MFEKYVQSVLAKIPTGENFVAVLKGIPSDLAEDLEAAAANPLKYFNAAVSAGRKNFTYEEFLLLKDFLAAQFDEIFMLNNNLYISQYPIESKFSAGTLANLLEHFSEPEIEQGRDR